MKQQTAKPRFRGTSVDLVVDVRSWIEYWLGHLPGAVCVPGELLPDALTSRPGISPSSRILVYCASGGRSATAAERLRAAGYTRVVDAGGLSAAREHFTP